MKSVLVTGASGFCGRHLCRHLSETGFRVTGTWHHTSVRKKLSRVNFIRCNLLSFSEIQKLIKRVKPDFVCHLAAMSVPRLSWKLENETFEVNTAGTIYLLEALRRLSPKTKFLFASTVQVYGRTFREGRPVRETDLMWPENPYAASKAAAESACLDYFHRFGIPVVVARAFNHLGRGQTLQFVLSDWCRQVALAEKGKRRRVLEVGNLDAYRDFLHVKDVVRAYEILLAKGNAGEIYNICYGKVRILKDYVNFLRQKSKVPLKVEVQGKRLRRNDPPVMKGNASRLHALGWRPELSPLKALEELLEEWREKV